MVMAQSGSVDTSNVVGYVNTDGANGFTVFAPMFVECDDSGDALLGKITGNFEPWEDTIQILNDLLDTSDLYYWTEDDSGLEPVFYWSSDLSSDDSDVVIPRGAGVVISSTEAVIQNRGQVEATAVSIDCETGYTVLGNPIPVAITLGDITFAGLSPWDDTLQFFNNQLDTADLYYWIEDDSGDDPVFYWSLDFSTDN